MAPLPMPAGSTQPPCVDTIGAVLPPSVLGIPEAEFTPRVRDAIMALMREMDGLSHELNQTRTRLDEVEKTADLDAVLPMLNRRAFIRELTRYIAFTARYKTPASLIYFDLNHLKQINDTLRPCRGRCGACQISPRCCCPMCAKASVWDGWAATNSPFFCPMPARIRR